MLTEDGPFFWMLKFYDSHERSREEEERSVVIFELIRMFEGGCHGRWFW